MTNNPTLPNFPNTIFATTRRREQAAIRQARQKALLDHPGGLSSLFSQVLHPDFLNGLDATKRQRHFGNKPVFWAWLYQIFHSNASCSSGLAYLQCWSADNGLPVPTSDTSSYCQARKRLPVEFVDQAWQKSRQSLASASSSKSRWRGLRLMALDGSKVDLADTPSNQAEYPQHSSQKHGCGYPSMGIAALFDLGTGSLEALEFGKQSGHDIIHAPSLLDSCSSSDLLLGDRGFCSYELMALAQMKGVETLIRLHQARYKALMKSAWPAKGDNLEVVWNKPIQPSKSLLSKAQWKALPNTLRVRYVRLKGKNRYESPDTLVVVTSLLDCRKYRAKELAELYLRRWEIEVNLRHLKTTLDLEMLDLKSPQMARKAFKMAAVAYNLLRWLMLKAKEGVALSFAAVLQALRTRANSSASQGKFSRAYRSLIKVCSGFELLIRPGRRQPRAKKRRPKSYPILTSHRSTYQQPIHNGRKPKNA